MATPETESELREMLKLDKFAEQSPVERNKMMEVLVIDLKDWSNDAILNSFENLDDEILREVLAFRKDLLQHNNVSGHCSSGVERPFHTSMWVYAAMSGNEAAAERIKNLSPQE